MVTLRFVVLCLLVACGGGSTGEQLGDLDPRCSSLCASADSTCSTDVDHCELECQVRVAGMEALCATCLLEGAHKSPCSPGLPCCPDPVFDNTIFECANACANSAGVNPSGDHPICTAICSDSDPACASASASCFTTCNARVDGVTGKCALCLLEGANGGSCDGGGGPCCPTNPQFPNTASECSAICGA